jgi:cation transport ATPase
MESERSERIRYFGFAAFVGALLLLYVLGYFKTLFGINIAAIIAVLAGYRIFFNAISALLEKKISADLAICIAVIAALVVGEYAAAAEAMFIMLVGEGLESYAAGRTSAAIERFVERMPRLARLLRDGKETEVDAESLLTGDIIVVRAGERLPAVVSDAPEIQERHGRDITSSRTDSFAVEPGYRSTTGIFVIGYGMLWTM